MILLCSCLTCCGQFPYSGTTWKAPTQLFVTPNFWWKYNSTIQAGAISNWVDVIAGSRWTNAASVSPTWTTNGLFFTLATSTSLTNASPLCTWGTTSSHYAILEFGSPTTTADILDFGTVGNVDFTYNAGKPGVKIGVTQTDDGTLVGGETHVVLIVSDAGGNTVTIYTNGVLAVQTSGNMGNKSWGRLGGFSPSSFLVAWIREIGVYTNRALSSIEIAGLQNYATNAYPEGQTQGEKWARRVVANGGDWPSPATITALNTFYSGLTSDGIVSKMYAVNCFVPDNLTASITPLITTLGSDPWVNHNFVSGDLTVNGLIGNASNKYLDTGIIPSANGFAYTDIGLTVYNSTSANEAAGEMGSASGSFTVTFALQNFSNSSYYDSGAIANARIGPIVNAAWAGYLSGNRVSASSAILYKANSGSAHAQIGSDSSTIVDSRSSVTWPITIFGVNLTGSIQNYYGRRLSFAAIHRGLTSTESANFFSRIQTLRTSLGGGFL